MPYVRNAWYVAGWSHELAPETPMAITILGERIVVWRSAAGNLHALEDRCVHRLAPLSLGRADVALHRAPPSTDSSSKSIRCP